MKKTLIIFLALLWCASLAYGFLYEIKILSAQEIKALSDEQLTEVYTEAKIEEKTSAEFHVGAGFSSAKDYNKRKELMRYIIELRKEMQRRAVEVPPVDEWLK